MDKVVIDGKTFEGWIVPTQNASLLIIRAKSGMLCCGYISIDTADKMGETVAIVRGVKNYGDMLEAKVSAISKAAKEAGIKIGESGKSALLKMA